MVKNSIAGSIVSWAVPVHSILGSLLFPQSLNFRREVLSTTPRPVGWVKIEWVTNGRKQNFFV